MLRENIIVDKIASLSAQNLLSKHDQSGLKWIIVDWNIPKWIEWTKVEQNGLNLIEVDRNGPKYFADMAQQGLINNKYYDLAFKYI